MRTSKLLVVLSGAVLLLLAAAASLVLISFCHGNYASSMDIEIVGESVPADPLTFLAATESWRRVAAVGIPHYVQSHANGSEWDVSLEQDTDTDERVVHAQCVWSHEQKAGVRLCRGAAREVVTSILDGLTASGAVEVRVRGIRCYGNVDEHDCRL